MARLRSCPCISRRHTSTRSMVVTTDNNSLSPWFYDIMLRPKSRPAWLRDTKNPPVWLINVIKEGRYVIPPHAIPHTTSDPAVHIDSRGSFLTSSPPSRASQQCQTCPKVTLLQYATVSPRSWQPRAASIPPWPSALPNAKFWDSTSETCSRLPWTPLVVFSVEAFAVEPLGVAP